jgi:flavin reductase (DIM6/NTAB) family NADH-FMN oxidoreductase RutF
MSTSHSHSEPTRRLTSDEFRDVIGHFASGVTVVTTTVDDAPAGTTASAVTSLTLEPPMVLICLNRESATGQAIAAAGTFAINILGEGHRDLALRFARKGGAEKFDGVAVADGAYAGPLLSDALARLECRVAEQVVAGTHVVFIADVLDGTANPGEPLAYFRGRFGRLELATATETSDQAPPGGSSAADQVAALRRLLESTDALLAEAERRDDDAAAHEAIAQHAARAAQIRDAAE